MNLRKAGVHIVVSIIMAMMADNYLFSMPDKQNNNVSGKDTGKKTDKQKITKSSAIQNRPKKQVWIDADLAVGMKRQNGEGYSDVDDGYAILQLMLADNVNIHGISTVFGNTSIDNAYRLGQKMSRDFANDDIPVYKGAAGAMNLEKATTNDAVEAMAEALKQAKLTIMAIGPATNVGILLLKYPELRDQIREIVLVAGRRSPEAHFAIGTEGYRARDFNFEQDPHAFQVLLQSQVPVTLCPFEISSKVRIQKEDLDQLAQAGPGARWLAENSRPWLNQWINRGEHGFHPFDVLASHYIINADDIISEPLNARLEIHPDDVADEKSREVFKQYLLCNYGEGTPVKYCYDVVEGYHDNLINSLVP